MSKGYRGRFSNLPPERQRALRSRWAKKGWKTRRLVQTMYEELLQESGLTTYFTAPASRGGADFAFQVDEITGIRTKRGITPVFDPAAHADAVNVIQSTKNRRMKVTATFVWQDEEGNDLSRTASSDDFTNLSDEDISEAYYELAGDISDEVYEAAGDGGAVSFSVAEINVELL